MFISTFNANVILSKQRELLNNQHRSIQNETSNSRKRNNEWLNTNSTLIENNTTITHGDNKPFKTGVENNTIDDKKEESTVSKNIVLESNTYHDDASNLKILQPNQKKIIFEGTNESQKLPKWVQKRSKKYNRSKRKLNKE